MTQVFMYVLSTQYSFIFNLFGNAYKILMGKTEGKRAHLEDLNVGGRII
jgi:hypothetical protein